MAPGNEPPAGNGESAKGPRRATEDRRCVHAFTGERGAFNPPGNREVYHPSEPAKIQCLATDRMQW